MSARVKKNDVVAIMSGKDRGKTGKVLKVFPETMRVVVEGVNMRKRRERARRAGTKGQVVEVATPVALPNVLVFCSSCKKGVRVGQKLVKDKKIRVCRKCDREL